MLKPKKKNFLFRKGRIDEKKFTGETNIMAEGEKD